MASFVKGQLEEKGSDMAVDMAKQGGKAALNIALIQVHTQNSWPALNFDDSALELY